MYGHVDVAAGRARWRCNCVGAEETIHVGVVLGRLVLWLLRVRCLLLTPFAARSGTAEEVRVLYQERGRGGGVISNAPSSQSWRRHDAAYSGS